MIKLLTNVMLQRDMKKKSVSVKMAVQVPEVLLVIKEKKEWKVNRDPKELLVLEDQKVMLVIKEQVESTYNKLIIF